MKPILDIKHMTRMEQHTHAVVAYSLLHGLLELAPHEIISQLPDLERVLECMGKIYKSIQISTKFSAGAEKRIKACVAAINTHNYDSEQPVEEQCRAFAVWWSALYFLWFDATNFAPQWTYKAEAEWKAVKKWLFDTSDALVAQYGERVDNEALGLYLKGKVALGHQRTPFMASYWKELEEDG